MNKMRHLLFAFVIFGFLGCATTLPPPKPLGPERGGIGISVKTRPPVRIITDTADMVYFIKVDEEEGLYTQGFFIQSNYVKGGQVYLLNVKPGRYAAVGSFKRKIIPLQPSVRLTTFFSAELIKLTEVTVPAGTIVFAGEYVVDTSTGLKDADDAQVHYAQLIAPAANFGLLVMSLSGDYYYTGSLREETHDKQAEIRFLTNALEHLKDTDWISIIQKRIGDVKAEK